MDANVAIGALANGPLGFGIPLRLQEDELDRIRSLVRKRWLSRIAQTSPLYLQDFEVLGIERYHELAHLVPHSTIWAYDGRYLPDEATDEIAEMPTFRKLWDEVGSRVLSKFRQEDRQGQMNFRVVRPGEPSDAAPLHADRWFWDLGYGVGPSASGRVKVWISLYCEPGLSGLYVLPGTHTKDWPYRTVEGGSGPRFEFVEGLDLPPAELLRTEPGDMVIFHDKLLHGGWVTQGRYTRVSIEFTILVP